MSKVTVEFPLKNNGKNIGFDAIPEDKIEEAIKFNIKNIILTNPGERTWDVEFGVGVMQALFEPATESLIEKIRERIRVQIGIYAPYITLLRMGVRYEEEQKLRINLSYEIDISQTQDSIEIEISNNLIWLIK